MARYSTARRQRGVTLILVALLLFVFIAIAALAVDIGLLYTARTSAQHAADAAALAGAYEFTNPCASPTPPSGCIGWTLTGAAFTAATRTAEQNTILGASPAITAEIDTSPCPAPDGDSWVCIDTTNRRVAVNVARTGANGIAAHFARIFGLQHLSLSAFAVAEAGTAEEEPSGDSSHALKPVFLPNTIFSSLLPSEACTQRQVIFDEATRTITAWADPYFGQPLIIRPGDPHKAAAPSQFFSLDFSLPEDPLRGGAMYRCTWGASINECGGSVPFSCNDMNVSVVNPLDVETGNMVGPTTEGINLMIGSPPTDDWSSYQERLEAGPTSSPNLAVAPIWDNCNPPEIRPGTNYGVHVLGFVQIFVDSVVQSGSSRGDVTARILRTINCDEVDFGGTEPPPPGPYTIPIRLVHTSAQD